MCMLDGGSVVVIVVSCPILKLIVADAVSVLFNLRIRCFLKGEITYASSGIIMIGR
jgi:hypothetical protein